MIRVGILVVSDKGAYGKREDASGKKIEELIKGLDTEIVRKEIIPDEKDMIIEKLKDMVDCSKIDLVITTGGTGLGKRDVTPEATLEVIDREVRGFSEIMRVESFKITPHSIHSRGVTGTRGKSLIINLPGSPKAVEECLRIILPAIPHAIEVLKGEVEECGAGKGI